MIGRPVTPKPVFFPTPADLRRWFTRNHRKAAELWVGYYKKASGRASVDWPQSVDQALCFGWIDGIRKSLGPDSYTIRFTPRRKGSIWSSVNLRRVPELEKLGQMTEAGRQAFEVRREDRSRVYSYERRHEAKLTPQLARRLKANAKAWAHFQSQPPGYQHIATFYVMSAKREETRARRLEVLIAASAAGRRIGILERPTPTKSRATGK